MKQVQQLSNGKFSTTYLVEENGELFIAKKLKEVLSTVELDLGLDIAGVQKTLVIQNKLLLKEYIEGVPFTALEFSVIEKLEIIYKLLDILRDLHEKQVIHCDLKPANIIIDSNNSPHVIDLGLALRMDKKLTKRPRRFAMIYAPPELVINKLQFVGPHTDLYFIAAILVEVLSLRKIHEAGHPAELINLMLAHPIQKLKCSEKLSKTLTTLLEKPDFAKPYNQLSSKELDAVLLTNTTKRKTVKIEVLQSAILEEIQQH